MNSHRATTTAMVVDAPLGREEVTEALRSSLAAGGWLDPSFCSPELATEIVDGFLADVRAVADGLPVGSIVRRRLDDYTSSVVRAR